MNILWTKEAVQDLDEVYSFYRDKNRTAADKIYNTIINETEILINHPLIAPLETLLADKSSNARSLLILHITIP